MMVMNHIVSIIKYKYVLTVSNIKLDSIAQNLALDTSAEARFAMPFENLNIQLINLEKRVGKNLSWATKGPQDVEKKGMVFMYSNLELRVKGSKNINYMLTIKEFSF